MGTDRKPTTLFNHLFLLELPFSFTPPGIMASPTHRPVYRGNNTLFVKNIIDILSALSAHFKSGDCHRSVFNIAS